MHADRTSLTQRALAVALYLGLAPLSKSSLFDRSAPFVKHHHRQALATLGILVTLLLVGALALPIDYYLQLHHPSFYVSSIAKIARGTVSVLAGLLILYSFGRGIAQAARGLHKYVGGISLLAQSRAFRIFSHIGGTAFLLVALFVISTTIRAESLTRRLGAPGRIYMLYDDVGFVPHWVFNLGFYRMSVAATKQWGRDKVVVDELTFESFKDALRHGEIIFLATHGIDGTIQVSRKAVPPLDVISHFVNPRRRLVYIAACDAGREAFQWNRIFAPARVISFNRLSAIQEHIWWLWVTGPQQVRLLK